jgi:putative transposase
VALEFIQPGKPIQNAVIESYNGRMRDELLNGQWWRTLGEAQGAVTEYRQDYNEVRPHSALAGRTPNEVARALRTHDLGVAVA